MTPCPRPPVPTVHDIQDPNCGEGQIRLMDISPGKRTTSTAHMEFPSLETAGAGGPLGSWGKSGPNYAMMAVRNVPPNSSCLSERVSLVKFRLRTWPGFECSSFCLWRQLSPLVNTQNLRGRDNPKTIRTLHLLWSVGYLNPSSLGTFERLASCQHSTLHSSSQIIVKTPTLRRTCTGETPTSGNTSNF